MTTKLTKFGAKLQLIERATLVFDTNDVQESEIDGIIAEEGWRIVRSGPYVVKCKVQGTKSQYILERPVGEIS